MNRKLIFSNEWKVNTKKIWSPIRTDTYVQHVHCVTLIITSIDYHQCLIMVILSHQTIHVDLPETKSDPNIRWSASLH